MIQKLYRSYIDSYKGLRKEVWLLTLVTFINRAGTMVLPFLSIYLRKELGYGYKEISFVLLSFGGGSVVGGWLGGKLSDKFGFYQVMFWSLLLSGLLIISVRYVESFALLCTTMFFIMVIGDSFRPAAYVALTTYSKPENRTRSVSLFRLAISFGFAMGPALGGLFIEKIGYFMIFWSDGITCVVASFLFIILLSKKQSRNDEKNARSNLTGSPYKDKVYMLYIVIVFLMATAFMQVFSTFPLFFKEKHMLSEGFIGTLMMVHGLLVFFTEMPTVKYLEGKKYPILNLLMVSSVFFILTFLSLNMGNHVYFIYLAYLFLTFGVVINFPFLNRFALDRSLQGKQGEYMSLFTIVFSLAHMIGSYVGMQFVDKYGFRNTWYIFITILVLALLLYLYLKRLLLKEVK